MRSMSFKRLVVGEKPGYNPVTPAGQAAEPGFLTPVRFFLAKDHKVWLLPSTCIEDGHVYPRIDTVRKGRFIGEPRIFRDRPHDTVAQAFEVARSIANELDTTELH